MSPPTNANDISVYTQSLLGLVGGEPEDLQSDLEGERPLTVAGKSHNKFVILMRT